jgi:Protein of unknown function (DUF4089)
MLRESGASSNRRCLLDRPVKPGDDEKGERRLTDKSADPLDDYIDAVGKALALPIDQAWRPAVKANLEVSLRLARLVDEFPLPDETEPASVFAA